MVDPALEALVEHAAHGLVVVDSDGVVRSANAAARRLIGSPGNPLVGSFPARYTADRRADVLASLRAAASGTRLELPLVSTDDHVERSVEIVVSTLGDGVLGLTLADMSGHQSLYDELERLASVPEIAPHPILELDARGRPTYRNRASEALGDSLPAVIERAMGTRELLETDRIRADGRTWSVVFQRIPAWELVRVYATDVSAQVEGEEALAHANAELEERVDERTRELAAASEAAQTASRAKSAFLANMSHELRTPLNAIIGYAELLTEDAPSEELGRIRVAAGTLLQLVDDVLDLAKIEAGRMELIVEPVDLRALLGEVEALGITLAARNGNRLKVDVASSLGPIRTDAAKVRQVLLNLVSNATKFTKDGVVTMSARPTRAPEGDAPWVELAVQDTGIGIPAEHLPRLFRPFVQADASTTRRFGGTGLGLALCREFVQLLGGTVSVTSEVGKGTRFVVKMPAAPAVVKVRTPTPTPRSRHGAQILVIDDDADARDLVVRTLAPLGYDVRSSSDGDAGLAMATSSAPALILLDVRMPGRDGWSVLGTLKATPGLDQVPVVLFTMVDDKPYGLSLGAADYLVKPVTRARLIDAVARATQKVGGRVLVCEDDEPMRSLVARTLTSAGWEVEVARDGEEAVARLAGEPPAIVLLDLKMPGLDGFEVVDRLRADPRWAEVPIVVMTGMELSRAEEDRLRALTAEVVRKGMFEREHLVRAVEAALARWAPATYTPPSGTPG